MRGWPQGTAPLQAPKQGGAGAAAAGGPLVPGLPLRQCMEADPGMAGSSGSSAMSTSSGSGDTPPRAGPGPSPQDAERGGAAGRRSFTGTERPPSAASFGSSFDRSSGMPADSAGSTSSASKAAPAAPVRPRASPSRTRGMELMAYGEAGSPPRYQQHPHHQQGELQQQQQQQARNSGNNLPSTPPRGGIGTSAPGTPGSVGSAVGGITGSPLMAGLPPRSPASAPVYAGGSRPEAEACRSMTPPGKRSTRAGRLRPGVRTVTVVVALSAALHAALAHKRKQDLIRQRFQPRAFGWKLPRLTGKAEGRGAAQSLDDAALLAPQSFFRDVDGGKLSRVGRFGLLNAAAAKARRAQVVRAAGSKK